MAPPRPASPGPGPMPEEASGLPVLGSGLADRITGYLVTLHPATATALTALAGFVVLLAVGVGLGLLVRDVLGLGQVDADVARFLADSRRPTASTISFIGSSVAGIWEVPVGMTLSVTALLVLRKWWWGAFLLIGIVLEGLLYTAITFLFSRERPPVHRLENLIHNDSFPSGHTTAAIVMYAGIAIVVTAATRERSWRVLAWSAAVLVPLFVAWSRLYRGMHYLTDALAGAVLGVGCILVALVAVRVGETTAAIRASDARSKVRALGSGGFDRVEAVRDRVVG